ncbi:MAG: hypothetical protein LBM77_01715 [Spirochaetaceae bacterium]|jgi:hypothetical protein|nr:hypothetical protein [Spirochaetaceae bacterium]
MMKNCKKSIGIITLFSILTTVSCGNAFMENELYNLPGIFLDNASMPLDINTSFSLSGALKWLKENSVDNTTYRIQIAENASIDPQYMSEFKGKNINIILSASDKINPVIRLATNASKALFHVDCSTLTLDGAIILQGANGPNQESLIEVYNTGILRMKAKAKIQDSITGAVHVTQGGVFELIGGSIENCSSVNGGAVSVSDSGKFSMQGGIIQHNTAMARYVTTQSDLNYGINGEEGALPDCFGGGGVFIGKGGIMEMSGGEISQNVASPNGGGVLLVGLEGGEAPVFLMTGGIITKNTVQRLGTGDTSGGGVALGINSVFTMQGGTISFNNGADYGGGLAVHNGSFIFEAGSINNNISHKYGGGVYITQGASNNNTGSASFLMSGGDISENKSTNGGGFYIGGEGDEIVDTVSIQNVSITNNIASAGGGAYFLIPDSALAPQYDLSGISIDHNIATSGGGIQAEFQGSTASLSLKLENTKITANLASQSGGGIYSTKYQYLLYDEAKINCASGIDDIILNNLCTANSAKANFGEDNDV